MTISINQLKIYLDSNIKKEPILFEYSLLFSPTTTLQSNASYKYPYFSNSVEYPMTRLKTYNYEEIVEFFFDKTIFESTLRRIKKQKLTTPQRTALDKKNIRNMLLLLFPTCFPKKK